MKRIESERLILREWTLDDCDDLFEYAKSDLVGPSAGWKPHESIKETKSIIEMFIREGDTYAIELKSGDKVIGSVGLHESYPDESVKSLAQKEVGYVLNPKHWGKGYIPEAVDRIKTYAFEEMKLDLLWCGHYDFNTKSKRVNEKCGFNYQFTKSCVLERLDNKKVEMLYYNITSKDFLVGSK